MELLQYTFFQHALIGSLLASIACGLIGTYIVTRRLVFISGGLTHASFGGIGLGLYTGISPILSAALFAVLSAFGVEWLSKRKDMREDSAIAVFAAIDLEKEEGAKWLKECRIWMYRGAWAEWEIENIEMAVPISPEELRAKRNSILKHQSQMESAPFLGNDERLFWQRSEDRNRGTAALYDSLGLASYEAMEAFVEYIPL